jgi:hypothetical protein
MTTSDRPKRLKIGGLELDTPVFFPSVSSVKTALPPLDYIRFLNALNALNAQFLVSAFDISRSTNGDRPPLLLELTRARDAGVIVLMDSGNYESYWRNARSTWLPADFYCAIREFPFHLALGFDEQQPPSDLNSHLRSIIERHEMDQAAAGSKTIIPIIHGSSENLPNLCTEIEKIFGVSMLAVPERRLGDGFFERARTIMAIRQALDATGHYVGLHLLGTGNPISMAVYALAGADSFDGLEWCQTVVDHESALLFHFSHADFFTMQTSWGDENLPFQLRVLAHNLEFYADWMARLRAAINDGRGIEFCSLNFPRRLFTRCAGELGWEV